MQYPLSNKFHFQYIAFETENTYTNDSHFSTKSKTAYFMFLWGFLTLISRAFKEKILTLLFTTCSPKVRKKGSKKSPTKGLEFDEFSRQETSTVKRAFFYCWLLIGILYHEARGL